MRAAQYGSHGKYKNGGTKRVHVLIAELALGRPLPKGACIHHADGDKANNASSNLVICPSQAYHNLLHVRTEALEACGNANWRRCPFCKQWDDPEMMFTYSTTGRTSPQSFHRKCHTEYEAKRRLRNQDR